MPTCLSENQKVYLALMSYAESEGLNRITLSQQIPVAIRTLDRWREKGEVSRDRLGQVKKFLTKRGVKFQNFTLWDFEKSYSANLKSQLRTLLNFQLPGNPVQLDIEFCNKLNLASPLGLSSSVLTANADIVLKWMELGAPVVAFKTIRLVEEKYPPLPPPNLKIIPNMSKPLDVKTMQGLPRILLEPQEFDSESEELNSFSMANSVGVPSEPFYENKEEISRIVREKPVSSFFIVSIMGTGETADDCIENLVELAYRVALLGPDAIEINISCPNLTLPSTELTKEFYQSAALAKAQLTKVKEKLKAEKLGDIPIFLKIGYMPVSDLSYFVRETQPMADGYVAINTIPKDILQTSYGNDKLFQPAFPRPNGSKQAGVSGVAIKNCALEMIQNLNELRHGDPSEFAIVGVGGASEPEDFHAFLKAGADVVQCCTAAIADPMLLHHSAEFLKSIKWKQNAKTADNAKMVAQRESIATLGALPDKIAELTQTHYGREVTYNEVMIIGPKYQDRMSELGSGLRDRNHEILKAVIKEVLESNEKD